MTSILSLKILVISVIIAMTLSNKCSFPRGAEGFQLQNYKGTWYEIAKYQTAGGAYWEKDCVCTSLNAIQEKEKFLVHNICRNKTPQGKVSDVVGELIDEDSNNPGHYKQKMFWFTPSVDYTIVLQGELNGEEFSVEYDCIENFLFGRNYCVHFLSRKPNLSEATLSYLIEKVNEMGLNADNLPLTKTKHEGCW